METCEKQRLRQELRHRATALPPEYFQNAGALISARLLRLREYRQAKTVLAFAGTALEPNTEPFLRQALREQKRLALPLCTAPGRMEARLVSTLEDLRPGSYGILEPKPECPLLPPEEISFAVIPCVACDRFGNRLGHGGGYYDRYLSLYTGPAALVCPEALLQPSIPMGPLDRQVPLVVTEKDVFRNGSLSQQDRS